MPKKVRTEDEDGNDLPPKPIYGCQNCGEEFDDFLDAKDHEMDCGIQWGSL